MDSAEPHTARCTIFGDELKWVGLRVYSIGEKSWVDETLGSVGTLTPEKARKPAQETLARARLGADPARDKDEARKAASFTDLANAFLNEHVDAKRKAVTQRSYRYLPEQVALPALGNLQAFDASRRDVAKLHASMRDRPYRANRFIAVIAAMYSLGGKRSLVPDECNPARWIHKFTEHRRDHFLKAQKIERIGAALRKAETIGSPWKIDANSPKVKHVAQPDNRRTPLSPHATAAIRLLILTGSRLREILHLRWCDVDFQRGLILLPVSTTGKGTIVLSAAALGIVAALAELRGATAPSVLGNSTDFVVPGNEPGMPRADRHKPWRSIARHCGL